MQRLMIPLWVGGLESSKSHVIVACKGSYLWVGVEPVACHGGAAGSNLGEVLDCLREVLDWRWRELDVEVDAVSRDLCFFGLLSLSTESCRLDENRVVMVYTSRWS